MASTSNSTFKITVFMNFVLLIFAWNLQICHGSLQTFGFDIHHRFSDHVKSILGSDELPEKGSFEYYADLLHRDRIIHGRGLSVGNESLLTFSGGNTTVRYSSLHYANVSLGTPSVTFLVALDTGSDLFWLPCDCTSSCIHHSVSNSGAELDLNIYSPNASLTSNKVPCTSSLCEHQLGCSGISTNCPYQVVYLSNGTSSSGILIEDVLHLKTEDSNPVVVDARITFGCGQVQTGSFLDGAAPNGLFGLGMDKISVPSILSSAGLAADSFSMCFGSDGIGRITFGDKGSADQEETPFNVNQIHPTYNISVTQIIVGSNLLDIGFSAIFDSGTSYTYLNDPAYTSLSESFNSQAQDNRHPSDSDIPFEYCYDLSLNATSATIPTLNLTMKGGGQFPVFHPIVFIHTQHELLYCLAIVKTPDVNIIGQNFMTSLRIVFDREKLVLGWKKSNCYDNEDSSTLPINPRNSSGVPPSVAVKPGSTYPEATTDIGTGSHISRAPPPLVGRPLHLNAMSCILFTLVLPFLANI